MTELAFIIPSLASTISRLVIVRLRVKAGTVDKIITLVAGEAVSTGGIVGLALVRNGDAD